MFKSKDLLKGIGNYKYTNSLYDDWSPNYDQTLLKWNYKAPSKASLVLKSHIKKVPKNILDLACGTGLFAEEILKFFPNTIIDGMDISKKILIQARKKNIYNDLFCYNFDQKIFLKKKYDVISCIGAMTYTNNPKKLMLEIFNNINFKGLFIFTHRVDLWNQQDYPKLLENLSNKWKIVFISRPILYLPKNNYFKDKIKIKIVLLSKLN